MRALSKTLRPASTYGNKAAGLARLLSLGFNVPNGFVIDPSEPLDETTLWTNVQHWAKEGLEDSERARLAVRSSSPSEDSSVASHAGQFQSILRLFRRGSLMKAVTEVRNSGDDPLPVIVQVAIDALYSGVAFSCDPVSYEREPYVVSWLPGMGADLVAGTDAGSLLVLRSPNDGHSQWPHSPETLSKLVSGLKSIEDNLGRPADVEWAIDQDGKLWFLQARPVVLPQLQCIDARSGSDLGRLPGVIAGHPKMRLRAAASHRGVEMSNAAVLTVPSGSSDIQLPSWLPSRRAAGLSVVLLHPYRVSSRIQREFAQVDGMDVPFFTLGCRRYSIRKYPSHEAAAVVVADVVRRGLDQSWIASAIVQEIYDAEATGIVRRIGKEYLVELAVGHFLPKGVVDPSRIILTETYGVLESHRVDQEIAYRFINGHVVTESPVEQQLDLSDSDVAAAIRQIAPLFEDYPGAALEFGVSRDRAGKVAAYVIDMAESDPQSSVRQLTVDLIRAGVLSPGRATGQVARFQNGDDTGLDTHLLEEFTTPGKRLQNTVIVADRASVDLLPLVNSCGGNTAFVFWRASLLAHLCVILRERGIPALVVEDKALFDMVGAGSVVTVEASDPNWAGSRVQLLGDAVMSSPKEAASHTQGSD